MYIVYIVLLYCSIRVILSTAHTVDWFAVAFITGMGATRFLVRARWLPSRVAGAGGDVG